LDDLRHLLILGLVLILAMSALVTLAHRVKIAYPILLVIGGVLFSLIPGLPPAPNPSPDFTLLIILPPLIYGAAWNSSWRDLKANARPVGLLAIGLVLATMLVVGAVAHAALGFAWPAALTLGAIVSPTDAIAATSVASRVGAPRRLVTVLEGESLINDATGLVLFRFALAAALTGRFSPGRAVLDFVIVSVGGAAIGLAIGLLASLALKAIDDPPVEILLSVVTAYAAYLVADVLGTSGVLACVAAGLLSGRRASTVYRPRARLEGAAVWETLTFLFNGVVFILLGLELSDLRPHLVGNAFGPILLKASYICLAVVVTRMLWVFPGVYLPRLLSPALRKRDPAPPWQVIAVLGWAGMRGAISLALALAVPTVTYAGIPFPERTLVIICTFAVILVTLVGQGLTLPWLMRRLGVADDGSAAREELTARIAAATQALERISSAARDAGLADGTADHQRTHYRRRIERLAGLLQAGDAAPPEGDDTRRFRRELLGAEREAIARLRDSGEIGDDVLRRIERDLDLEEERLQDLSRSRA
jgi:CPA1 family monovalent cation:H+ antiporter